MTWPLEKTSKQAWSEAVTFRTSINPLEPNNVSIISAAGGVGVMKSMQFNLHWLLELQIHCSSFPGLHWSGKSIWFELLLSSHWPRDPPLQMQSACVAHPLTYRIKMVRYTARKYLWHALWKCGGRLQATHFLHSQSKKKQTALRRQKRFHTSYIDFLMNIDWSFEGVDNCDRWLHSLESLCSKFWLNKYEIWTDMQSIVW